MEPLKSYQDVLNYCRPQDKIKVDTIKSIKTKDRQKIEEIYERNNIDRRFLRQYETFCILSSQSSASLWNGFFELLDKDSFSKSLLKLRKQLGIPISGLEFENEELDCMRQKQIILDRFGRDRFEKLLINVCSNYGFPVISWDEIFYQKIVYDNIYTVDFGATNYAEINVTEFNIRDYLNVIEAVQSFTKDSKRKEFSEFINFLLDNIETYRSFELPIALYFGSKTSKEDLIDFIEKNYRSLILPIQNSIADDEKEGESSWVNLSKSKRKARRNKKLDDFLLDNQHMNRVDLARKANGLFPGHSLTYTEVTKRIYDAKKRRGN